MTPQSILITGGSGYLGRALVRAAIGAGCERVCVYSRGEHAQAALRDSLPSTLRSAVRFFIGDVRDRRRLERALRGVSAVIHAAALKRIEVGESDPGEMVRTNVDGTINVIDACLAAGVDRLVYVSTDKAVAPVGVYGATKLVAERLVLGAPHPLSTAVARYGNVAGSTGSVIPRWRADPASAFLTDPDCTRYWMTRDQAVELVLNLASNWATGVHFPKLPAYRLGDLAGVLGVNRGRVVGLPKTEKLHETMDGETDSSQARRLSIGELALMVDALEDE